MSLWFACTGIFGDGIEYEDTSRAEVPPSCQETAGAAHHPANSYECEPQAMHSTTPGRCANTPNRGRTPQEHTPVVHTCAAQDKAARSASHTPKESRPSSTRTCCKHTSWSNGVYIWCNLQLLRAYAKLATTRS